jgi:hypothetical protein
VDLRVDLDREVDCRRGLFVWVKAYGTVLITGEVGAICAETGTTSWMRTGVEGPATAGVEKKLGWVNRGSGA